MRIGNTLSPITLALGLNLIIWGCKTDEEVPPPSPPIIDNLMAADIDGVPWESCQSGILGGTIYHVTAQEFTNNYFDIDGLNVCSETENYANEVYLKIGNFSGVGTYVIGGISSNQARVKRYALDGNGKYLGFDTNSSHDGELIITKYDTMPRQLSGSFEFTAFNVDSNTTVTVSNGTIINVTYLKF